MLGLGTAHPREPSARFLVACLRSFAVIPCPVIASERNRRSANTHDRGVSSGQGPGTIGLWFRQALTTRITCLPASTPLEARDTRTFPSQTLGGSNQRPNPGKHSAGPVAHTPVPLPRALVGGNQWRSGTAPLAPDRSWRRCLSVCPAIKGAASPPTGFFVFDPTDEFFSR
ncbi:uncharacterized protein B0H64DRAFT_20238 [Chaetomium fimeti]|uniref:Uncharacterized protein n=1 Tax=Chaetomium fimeti TaxID=1854472 RepID=A0AAE0HQF1_9PEZI|nr:hypothetical protein B0H64DRAFT_20238 [Chaetomium fimeti]